jgi:putative mRNA 3-end processing factor
LAILEETSAGLYCAAGDFYVDPWKPVPRAVITHAHSDHARSGCDHYLAAKRGDAILRMRIGQQSDFTFTSYGEIHQVGAAKVSLHPSGHMTGAAQVRIEVDGEIWVVSGDYKLQTDPTCETFEPVRCHTFVTESTFGLPIYRWEEPAKVFEGVNEWWRKNQSVGKASLLMGYTVGKSQRCLASVDPSIGPIFAHGAILNACRAYEACGVQLPQLLNVMEAEPKYDWSQALIVAPPSSHGTTWLRRFGDVSMAMASGWMAVRGIRRRRVVDRGFVISDHVDWQDLMTAIEATGAENVWVTHGYTSQVVRTLQDRGLNARTVITEFTGEIEEPVGEKLAEEPATE